MSTYLDHAATSPLRPEVAAAMAEVHQAGLGNPSGAHALARAARRRLDDAREEIASILGRHPGDVVLTSGGTEADNLAVLGVGAGAGGQVACPATEHHAVLDAVRLAGGAVLPVGVTGLVDLDAVAGWAGSLPATDPGRRPAHLLSVMLANNETGVLADLTEVAAALGGRALLHSDAVAAARWVDVAAEAGVADLVSLTAHKLGGPVGTGALVVPADVPVAARQLGGGQERGRRSGTVDVAGAIGLATALRLAAAERDEAVERVGKLRDRLAAGLLATVGGLVETAAGARRTAGTCHVCIPGVAAEAVLFLLDAAGICASAASSCASGAQQASHVLAAMGVDPALARGSLRFSLGPTTSDADIDRVLATLPAAVDRLREEGAP